MSERKYPEWMGKMRGLTPEEIQAFLAGPVVARVATIDQAGVPYITPVWQEWDGAAMWIVPRERSAWVTHIQHQAQVAVSCALDNSPYTRVLMRGVAEIVSGPEPMQGHCLEVANRMALRYLGEHGPEYLVPTYDRPRYLIRFRPNSMVSWEGVEWAQHYLKAGEESGDKPAARQP
jgi:nitroimidazol reductase NimA-like FMN-containing flavoprotein (pyridoxamine 5'-phosphate oxidase superfamily)